MPRYDYKCKKCGESFEVTHGIGEKVESCEKCGGEVRRVFHPIGIVFKGSGFYATDSKKPDNKPGRPYSEIADEMDKTGSETKSAKDNGDKEKDKGAKDKDKGAKKSDDSKKSEKAAS